jgi:glycerophosphoryl diester phosphodiesterase
VWTVDSPDDARFFRDLGTVDITTNRPTLLREAFGEEQR